MLSSYQFRESNGQQQDQRPLSRYLRFLHATNPILERQTLQLALQGSEKPTETAYCNPFFWMCEMETNDKFGRHMVADQDIKKGETIGGEHPILFVTAELDRCAECDRLLPGNQGIRCNKHTHNHNCPLAFCSETCRDWAWEHYHKVQDPKDLATLYARNSDHTLLFVAKGLSMMQFPKINSYALSYIEAFLKKTSLASLC